MKGEILNVKVSSKRAEPHRYASFSYWCSLEEAHGDNRCSRAIIVEGVAADGVETVAVYDQVAEEVIDFIAVHTKSEAWQGVTVVVSDTCAADCLWEGVVPDTVLKTVVTHMEIQINAS